MHQDNRVSLKTRKIGGSRLLQKNSKEAETSDLSNQRRKIIKASAAVVPAIMTLSNGAAAAMTSSASRCFSNPDTPINITSDPALGVDVGGIDPVLGDYELAPPLDEWLRVMASAGMKLMYAPGNSALRPYYLVRQDNTTYSWDDINGWLIYDRDGNLKDGGARQHLLDDASFMTAWDNRVAFYGVDSSPNEMVFIDASGGAVSPSVPAVVSDVMKTSTTRVYLLCYYNPDTGVITYWPMPQGEALLITGSCLCSINPQFQL